MLTSMLAKTLCYGLLSSVSVFGVFLLSLGTFVHIIPSGTLKTENEESIGAKYVYNGTC